MTFRNLEYFLVVAEERSFARAAERLYISSQSISETINRLEKEFDIILFNRDQHPLSLTYAGEKFLEDAARIMLLKQNITNQLKNISVNTSGRVSFGISYGRGRIWIPSILCHFNRLYPNVEVNVMMGDQPYREACLSRGDVDFIVGYSSFDNPEIYAEELVTEPTYMIVPIDLMKEKFPDNLKETVQRLSRGCSVDEFADESFLLLKPCHNLRRIADALFRKHHIVPNVKFEAPDCELLLWLSVESMGISFWPQGLLFPRLKQLSPYVKERICVFPLSEPEADTKLLVGYHRANPPFTIAQSFIAMLKEHIQEYYSDEGINIAPLSKLL